MSAKPSANAEVPEAEVPAKARFLNKKMILVGAAAVVVLALIGAGAWFYFGKKAANGDDTAADGAEDAEVVVKEAAPKHPPTYLPLDNMVVNLADPGGEKVAQIGVTLEISDTKALEKVRLYLPTIRNAILMLVSQRTAEELLRREGKEKLAADIWREASRPFDGGPAGQAPEPGGDEAPVRGVLFSSFIVQ